jgi:hypothetical protein
MFYLICNVLFSTAFTLIIKWVHVRQREDIVTVGSINYIVAATLIAPQFFTKVPAVDVAAALCGAGICLCCFQSRQRRFFGKKFPTRLSVWVSDWLCWL